MVAAILVQSVALGAWHLPGPFRAAADHALLHALEHATFLATALLFWWAATGAGRRSRRGLAVLAVFAASLPATALGLLMTLASTPWYPHEGTAAAALRDQQLAGVVMWGVGNSILTVAAVACFASWLAGLERFTPARTLTAQRDPFAMTTRTPQ
jgi:cytochrome c oxidase assembly factor CtaG